MDTRHVRRLPRTASGPVSRPVISGINAEEIARPEFWNERNLATKTGLYDMPFVKGKGEKR